MHTRIQEFSSGGGGGGGGSFTEVKWLISKETIIVQGSRWGPTFSRGVQLFQGGGGGVKLLIPYRNL